MRCINVEGTPERKPGSQSFRSTSFAGHDSGVAKPTAAVCRSPRELSAGCNLSDQTGSVNLDVDRGHKMSVASSLSSPGVGSGPDVNGMVNKLVAIEKKPFMSLQAQRAGCQAKLSALRTFKGLVQKGAILGNTNRPDFGALSEQQGSQCGRAF